MQAQFGGRRRWWVLAGLVPVTLALNFDATVLTLALPTLADSLRASTSDLQWFSTGYLLAFAAVMIPGGMLGDRFGRKRVLAAALIVFAVGSGACAAATTTASFLAARLLLGLAAGFATPLTLSVLPTVFGEEDRNKAVAAVTAATMLAYPLGPILGGWILSTFWWGWVFLLNLPIVALALLCVTFFLPESRAPDRHGVDWPGVASASGGLTIVSYGLIEAGAHGWTRPRPLAEIALGAAVLTVFVLWERRVSEPLLDLGLFRSPRFTWGTTLATVISFALIGIFFSEPLYFQEILGTDAMGSGVRLLPMIAGLLVGAGAGAKLAEFLGARVCVSLGFAILAGGLAVGAGTSLGDGTGFAATWLSAVGLGTGLAMPTTIDAALGALAPADAGVGSGTVQALRMVGSSFGAAILGSVVNAGYRGRIDAAGLPPEVESVARNSVAAGTDLARQLHAPDLVALVRAAYVHGLDLSLLASAAAAVIGTVLALAFLPGRRPRAAIEGGRAETAPESSPW